MGYTNFPDGVNAGSLTIADVAVTATAAALNQIAGLTAGVITASKAVIANSAGAISNTGSHLALNSGLTSTDLAGHTIRLNNITNIGTANSFIGVQVKPAVGASTAQGITGAEFSPRVNDTFALTGTGTIIGLHADAYLKGTTGNIGGDVRALNLELVTDDAGARTITGNVNAIRIRSAFSGTTISGTFVPIRIEAAETQTNSKQYDAVLELPATNGAVWGVKGSDYTPAQPRAKIKVLVNGVAYWLVGYATEPS